MGKVIPNPDLLIRPYVTREAVLSSKIEGTEASMMDVFQFEARPILDEPKRYARIDEVVNYVQASHECFEQISSGDDVGMAMLKNAHRLLLYDVRGQNMMPGRTRTVQNWIGVPGCHIRDAAYVPPAPHVLEDALSNLIRFIANPPAGMPVLVQCALAHYQFESIHPFVDGNGRIGRLMIQLILAARSVLSKPLLYMSAYFERNRTDYYGHLQNISRSSSWTEWIEFFLNGVIQCSMEAVTVMDESLKLKSSYEQRLKEEKAIGSAIVLTGHLFSNPVITISRAAEYLKTGYPTAKRTVTCLIDVGILEQIGSKKRNKMYVAKEILDVFS